MKKILNLTRNEMDDIAGEEHYETSERSKLFTIQKKIRYTTASHHFFWSDDDEYKVIEI